MLRSWSRFRNARCRRFEGRHPPGCTRTGKRERFTRYCGFARVEMATSVATVAARRAGGVESSPKRDPRVDIYQSCQKASPKEEIRAQPACVGRSRSMRFMKVFHRVDVSRLQMKLVGCRGACPEWPDTVTRCNQTTGDCVVRNPLNAANEVSGSEYA